MEIEVKLELDESTYQKILRRCRLTGDAVQQHNVFFDSGRRDLKRAGWALRLRCEAGRNILTVKGKTDRTDDGLHLRPEFEVETSMEHAKRMRSGFRLTDFAYQPLGELLTRMGDLDVRMTYEFWNWRIRLGLGRRELGLDRTRIGDDTHFELELETDKDMTKQATRDLKDWFRDEGWAFRPSAKSKMAKAEEWFCDQDALGRAKEGAHGTER